MRQLLRPSHLGSALLASATLVVSVFVAAPAARAQAPVACNPACAAGQICWQGVCMVPAPRPAAPQQPPASGTLPGYPYRPPVAAPAAPGNYPAPPAQQQPGYPPPAQQGYPAQQGGYPPAPPPGYAPAAQPGAYPPGYQPPPGYAPGYPPPQGYPPGAQPGYGPAGAVYQQAPEDPRRRRLVVLPYLGLHSLVGEGSENLGVGFRTGAVVGYQLNQNISLGGELLLDIANPKNVPVGNELTALAMTFSFSPFFHLPVGALEFVAGPKVGITAAAATNKVGSTKFESTVSYLTLGTTAGFFFQLGEKLSIGGLVNFDLQSPVEFCTKVNEGSETCSKDNLGDAEKVFGTAVAILF